MRGCETGSWRWGRGFQSAIKALRKSGGVAVGIEQADIAMPGRCVGIGQYVPMRQSGRSSSAAPDHPLAGGDRTVKHSS